MGLSRKKNDAARVVGFDLGPAAPPSFPGAPTAPVGTPDAPPPSAAWPAANAGDAPSPAWPAANAGQAPSPAWPAANAGEAPSPAWPPADAAPAGGYPPPPAPGWPAAEAPAYPPPAFAPPAPYGDVATMAPPAYAPPGYAPPGGFGPPAWTAAQPAKPAMRKPFVVLLALVAAVIVVGLVAAVVAPEPTMPGGKTIPREVTLSTPEKIGNAKRLRSAFAKQVERETVKGMASLQQAQVGLYGTGSTPRYFMAAGFSPEQSSREMYDVFRTEAAKAEDGTTIGRPKAVGDLTCATLTVADLKGAVCLWASDRSNGALVDYTSRDTARLAKLAITAQRQVNGG